jgi:hypothetical protein
MKSGASTVTGWLEPQQRQQTGRHGAQFVVEHEDRQFGQWGLEFVDPAASDRHSAEFKHSRLRDFKHGDRVIERFLGDSDLLLIRCDPSAFLGHDLWCLDRWIENAGIAKCALQIMDLSGSQHLASPAQASAGAPACSGSPRNSFACADDC